MILCEPWRESIIYSCPLQMMMPASDDVTSPPPRLVPFFR
jgi:hypothetical protein